MKTKKKLEEQFQQRQLPKAEMAKLLDEFFFKRNKSLFTYGQLSIFFLEEISTIPAKWVSTDDFCEKYEITREIFFYMIDRLIDIGIVQEDDVYKVNYNWGGEIGAKLTRFIFSIRK